jgi:C1A family cysteine protease
MAFLNQSSIKIVENLKKESEIKYKKKQKKLSIKSIDWRKKGVVNPVKSQGSCGCCWAFGTTSAIESHVAIKFGFLPNLSEQNLADCVYDRNGQDCRGGMPSTAFDYIKNNGGIDTQEGYPYTSFNSSKVISTKLYF